MERYENIIKIEEIRRLIDENLYTKAAKILDTMDISRIKALTDLSIMADVLAQNDRYEEAMEILLKIYNKSKTRRVLYQLVDISIRMEDLDKANEYLKLYIKLAPTDSYRYVFRYCIDKLNQEPYEILIDSLEQLKEYEYIEMWAYELAKVYHKAGMKDKCVRECSDIILWFGDGVYVEKAKLLKAFYVGELNPANIIDAKNKKEALKQMDLDKTKDYSAMRDEINEYLAKEEKEMVVNKAVNKSSEDSEKAETMSFDNVEGMETKDSYKKEIVHNQEAYFIPKDNPSNDSKDIANSPSSLKQVYIDEEVSHQSLEEINKEYTYSVVEPIVNIPINMDYEFSGEEVSITANNKIESEIRLDLGIDNNIDADQDINTDQGINEEISTEINVGIDSGNNRESELDIYGYFAKTGFHADEEFGAFLLVGEIKGQIGSALENILSDSKNINHLVIAGKKKSGRSTLAKKICKGLFALDWIKSSKIAKITGDKLNQVNLSTQKDKLKNSTIVIEDASHLTEKACQKLVDFMVEMRDNIFVILEDEDKNLEEFFLKYPIISTYFINQVIIGEYSARDLFCFSEEYINEKNYQFLTEAKSEFFQKIGQILTESDKPLEETLNLAKAAVKAADNRYKSQLAEILNNRNLDTEDLLYIVKEDILEV